MSELAALRYVKGHGTANDFVVLPDPDADIDLTARLVQALCNRRTGLGADGVLRVVRADCMPGEVSVDDPDARWFMDYRNADGSIAEMCGNGIRVFARYLVSAGFAVPGRLRIATRDGVKSVDLGPTGDVTVDMGTASRLPITGCSVELDGDVFDGIAVTVGNPHVVVAVEDPAALGDLDGLKVHPLDAFPTGVNVEFVGRRGDHAFRVRVHERGVGETFSCGTGACAVVSALGADGVSSYDVDLPGGRLTVTRCDGDRVLLTGPAVLVAQGVLHDEWLAAAVADE
jgi:diaminopimelate epimerase